MEGANPNETGFVGFSKKKAQVLSNSLGAACFKKHFELALFILDKIDDCGVNERTGEVKDLPDQDSHLSNPSKIEFKDTTPIHLALSGAGDNAEKIFKVLKQKGADLSIKDALDNTILHWIAKENAVKIYKYCKLNDIEMDYTFRNKAGESPLSLAEKLKNREIVNLLKRDFRDPGADEIDDELK